MMKKTLLRSSIILIVIIILGIGANTNAIGQFLFFLPIVGKNLEGTPYPTVPIPETASATFPPVTTGKVEIRDISFHGTGSSEPDEYVEIENDDNVPIQLLDWTLSDKADHIFTFPNFVILPYQTCRVYTNEHHPEWCGFNYGSGSAIWNNGGDTAYLRDADGTLIDDYSY